jgi:trk system potassium uptake protein
MQKRFLVIGVGRFGTSIVKELHAQGNEVVACDREEGLLRKVDPYVNHSVIGDATDVNVLEDLNVTDFDSIVVSIGDNFEAAIMAVKNLKDMGCKNVYSKANDHKRGEVLAAVGADRVIYPEEETGTRIARQLANPGVLEYVQLAPNCSGMELEVPESFCGKNLIELDIRRKYGLTVVMISKKKEKFPIISPTPNTVFEPQDIFFVVGENEDLERLQKKLTKEQRKYN